MTNGSGPVAASGDPMGYDYAISTAGLRLGMMKHMLVKRSSLSKKQDI